MQLIEKLNVIFGDNRSPAWVDGFMAGYRGLGCPACADPDFEDGYGRGYEASEIESENHRWWKTHGRKK